MERREARNVQDERYYYNDSNTLYYKHTLIGRVIGGMWVSAELKSFSKELDIMITKRFIKLVLRNYFFLKDFFFFVPFTLVLYYV